MSYRYDAGGRLKEKWLPNGVNSRYAYFTDNTFAQVVNRSLTASIISQHDYSYDAYANRRQQTSTLIGSALTHTDTFDALDRLLTVKYGGTEEVKGQVLVAAWQCRMFQRVRVPPR